MIRTLSGCRLCSALFILSTMPLAGIAQEAHNATLAESLSRTSIRAPVISPDGRLVAYLKRETNWKENEFVWKLWRVNAAGEAVQLTRGRKSAGAAQWSPDGRWLAFVTEREAYVAEPFAAVQKDVAAQDGGKGDAADAAKPAAKQ